MSQSPAPRTTPAGWRFDNSYSRLPQCFHEQIKPVAVREPKLVLLNEPLAEALGLNPVEFKSEAGARYFSGNETPAGAEPLAQAYAGHQFGHFTMLGDGRANLLGEHITPAGDRYDIQLKGSGRTSFSRRGDGRAALGPMLREYIISEAMHALGIPTTRSLAVVTTGEPVYRDTVQPGAILTRVAASHIRVGTFAYAASWGTPDDLKALADYAIQRHYPEILESEPSAKPCTEQNPYIRFLQAVIARQAALIAQWQLVGFIHGVMNTDNMTISGETIDYGPCAFMDAYDPATVFSSIDVQGRYAYGNQPRMAQWNLARLAEAILPLLSPNPEEAVTFATAAVTSFSDQFESHWHQGMRAKLGLFSEEPEDKALIDDLLQWMQQSQADFTNTFNLLCTQLLPSSAVSECFSGDPHYQQPAFLAWLSRWQARLTRQSQSKVTVFERMRAHNPVVIPRNHRVEEALAVAVDQGDLSVLERLLQVLNHPFKDTPAHAAYYAPSNSSIPYQTFCGT